MVFDGSTEIHKMGKDQENAEELKEKMPQTHQTDIEKMNFDEDEIYE